MIGPGVSEQVAVADIELDRNNPRIRKFLEMYEEDPSPEQIFQALGAGGDDEGGASGTTFEKLKQSILTSGRAIQPVILNRRKDGTLVCIDGNTRVALYKSFVTDLVKGNWLTITALVHDNLNEASMHAIRLQVHLVGPRAWDPYSKAMYLHSLRTQEDLPFAMIVDFCGGRPKDIAESINAYSDMENYYRPIIPEEGDFDIRRFSGFVELQKPGIKEAILQAQFTFKDFAQWIYDENLYPLSHVRLLPRILRNPQATEIFLKPVNQGGGSRKAEAVLAKPDLNKALVDAEIGQLARALTESIRTLPWMESQNLKSDPAGPTAQALVEVHQELLTLTNDLGLTSDE